MYCTEHAAVGTPAAFDYVSTHLYRIGGVCLNAIAQRRASQKPIIVKAPPVYKKQPAGWVLTPEEISIAVFIKDNRLPRHVTQCRICGKDIVAGEGRAAFKVKDDRGYNVREGFVHQVCSGGRN